MTRQRDVVAYRRHYKVARLGLSSPIGFSPKTRGLGYVMSTAEELRFVMEIATTTRVILDPAYSGKAAYATMKDMKESPKKWEGWRVLFVHTGGLLGLFDKADQMASTVGNWHPMDI